MKWSRGGCRIVEVEFGEDCVGRALWWLFHCAKYSSTTCVIVVVRVQWRINQSINRNLYSASSRSLLRGTPDPNQAEEIGLQQLVELGIATSWKRANGQG